MLARSSGLDQHPRDKFALSSEIPMWIVKVQGFIQSSTMLNTHSKALLASC